MRVSDDHIHEVHPPERGVLIVEDERVSRRALSALLESHGFHIEAVASAEEGLARLQAGSMPAVALVDLDLPGMNGLEFIERMEQMDRGVDPILITAADRDRIKKVLERHPMDCLQKPLDLDRLVQMLHARQMKH